MTRSYRGKEINMSALQKKYEKTIALGNGPLCNARGDLIGKNGKIIKTREDQLKEYRESISHQEGEVSMKSPEQMSDLEKTLSQYTKPEKIVVPKKKKTKEVEEPKEEPKAEERPVKREKTEDGAPTEIYDEE